MFRHLGPLTDLAIGLHFEPEELRRRIAARSAKLRECGLDSGHSAILLYGNSAPFLIDLFAIWNLGACAVPLDPAFTQTEVERIIRHCSSTLIVGAHPPFEISIPFVQWNTDAPSPTDPLEALSEPDPKGHALVLYTSGSTGEPKGVVHTHATLRARIEALSRFVPSTDLQNSLCLLPLHFGHGLIGNCLLPWSQGGHLFLWGAPFDLASAASLGEIIDQHRISFMSSVPAIWESTLPVSRAPAGNSLRRVHCASAPMRPAIWSELRAWTGNAAIKNVYGITEAGSWIAGTEGELPKPYPGCVGKAWGVEFELRNGQVWMRSDSLTPGYLDREDLTHEVIHAGWFDTGDIGEWDEHGNLVLLGRSRTTINRAGIKIYPEEIDQLLKSHPVVADACAFGIPDPISGQTVGAAVVFRSPSFTFDDLDLWVRQRTVHYKVPARWYRLTEIPRSNRGKVSREKVAAHCLVGNEP